MSSDIEYLLATQSLPDDFVIDNIYKMEELLEVIQKLNKKNERLSELNQYRMKVTKEKVSENTEKITRLRKIILEGMKRLAPDEKTIDFSPIGKITRKKNRSSWEVTDDQELIKFLKDKGLEESVIVIKQSLDKRELEKVLDKVSKSVDSIPGASLVPGEEGVTITYDKNYKASDDGDDDEMPEKPNKIGKAKVDVENLDELTI